uniref:CSON013352 protein n=1 Tax=Culicoides sonorensis TaxID=179676 RepID=A0A336LGA8_CULSO
MKYYWMILLFHVLLVATEFTPRTAQNMLKYDDECGAEYKIPPERIEELKANLFKEDRESYCHINCVAKKMEIFDDENGILVENLIKQLLTNNEKSETDMRQIIENCIKLAEGKKEDLCLWAFRGLFCLGEHGLKVSPARK